MMEFDFYYGTESEQFSFYRIPKMLFTDEAFKDISVEAKVLYGLLLDRMSLSQKNGWLDAENRVFIIFTIEEIMSSIGCADKKATRLLSELENKCGLIKKKRQGLGKPNLIYVKNFIGSSKARIQNRQNNDSATVKNTIKEPSKSRCNYTDINNTDFSDTENPIISPQEHIQQNISCSSERKDMIDRETYKQLIKHNIEYDILLHDNSADVTAINEMVELMLDTVCSNKKFIRIAGDNKSNTTVKSTLLKITKEHIEYCLMCLKENTTNVKNVRQYILTTLYNSTLTMSSYYGLRVQHDMSTGFI